MLSLRKASIPAPATGSSTLVRDRPVAVLSGPNIADEIVRGLPAAAVVASADPELTVRLQLAITSGAFRVYANEDIVGVEFCAAAKNVIALAAGAPTASVSATTRSRRSSRAAWRRWPVSPSPPAGARRPSPVSRAWAT